MFNLSRGFLFPFSHFLGSQVLYLLVCTCPPVFMAVAKLVDIEWRLSGGDIFNFPSDNYYIELSPKCLTCLFYIFTGEKSVEILCPNPKPGHLIKRCKIPFPILHISSLPAGRLANASTYFVIGVILS